MKDINGIDIKVGSRVKYVGDWYFMPDMAPDDTYEVMSASDKHGVTLWDSKMSRYLYVEHRECVVIIEDPIEFVEELPI